MAVRKCLFHYHSYKTIHIIMISCLIGDCIALCSFFFSAVTSLNCAYLHIYILVHFRLHHLTLKEFLIFDHIALTMNPTAQKLSPKKVVTRSVSSASTKSLNSPKSSSSLLSTKEFNKIMSSLKNAQEETLSHCKALLRPRIKNSVSLNRVLTSYFLKLAN